MRPRSLVQSHYEPVNFTLVQGHDPSLTPFIHSSQTEANVHKETWPSPANESGGKCCHYLRKQLFNSTQPIDAGKAHQTQTSSFHSSEFSSSFNIRTRATSSLSHPRTGNSEFSSASTHTENTDHSVLIRYAVVLCYF